ncbi:low temperature requirement protein A [Subtercola frigoramans]|uniref:Low temperature requirement protein LtrA n=1 Tax=Subtercola frigoramans TaxID=120298 RepID=A0ABS2L371_9MICO|nr:low temperature requirement protein A [Subtercola frigoramans]MBM7471552.1 low temperature requirement protein LtrA [Subtercola frigoramans]
MLPRDRHEAHRAASSLELFFDLVFVVAVSFASVSLHTLEVEHQAWSGLLSYAMVFFAIWWAWMNFTWFATAFDNDDWLYRVTTIGQMAGVLVLAAGVPQSMEHGDFALITFGYVIMRLAMVSQWIRVAANSPRFRMTALKYAAGITVVQLFWVLRLLLPAELGVLSFLVLVAAEVLVPIWAERKTVTPWHSHHIAERYGLFTLIVLGEGLLGSANAIINGMTDSEHVLPLIVLAASGLIVVAGMWWIYFAVPQHSRLGNLSQSLKFGYSHYFIFAAAGAVSAGIEVAVEFYAGHTELTSTAASLTFTLPVAVFILGVWALAIRPRNPLVRARRTVNTIIPVAAVLIAVSAYTPWSAIMTAAIVVLIVMTLVVTTTDEAETAEAAEAVETAD